MTLRGTQTHARPTATAQPNRILRRFLAETMRTSRILYSDSQLVTRYPSQTPRIHSSHNPRCDIQTPVSHFESIRCALNRRLGKGSGDVKICQGAVSGHDKTSLSRNKHRLLFARRACTLIRCEQRSKHSKKKRRSFSASPAPRLGVTRDIRQTSNHNCSGNRYQPD